MKINIIIPADMPERAKRNITNEKTIDDRIDIIELKSGTDEIKKVVESSNYEYFLVFNSNFHTWERKFIKEAKKILENDKLLIFTEERGGDEISPKNSFVGFKKGKEKDVTENHMTILGFLKDIISKQPKNKIKKIEKEGNPQRVVKPNQKRRSAKRKDVVTRRDSNKKPSIRTKSDKPKILFVCDVKGWAWWLKSEYIKKYLSGFDIDIIAQLGEGRKPIDPNKYDLYFTYGYSFIGSIRRAPYNRRITGVTAHRPLSTIKPKMQQAYAVHANSILLLNELKNIHNNCYYLPNGVDTMKFHPKETGRNNIVFGHVGKLSPQKGQKAFIEPAVEKAGVEYFPHYNNYKSRVPHNQMVDVYKNFDVKLVASFEDGTPGPALEAAACGKPLISNKIGNMPEFIKHGWNGLLVNRDINSYAEAIKYFKDNPDEVIRMGRNARITAEKWDWSKAVDNYRYMFKDILQMS